MIGVSVVFYYHSQHLFTTQDHDINKGLLQQRKQRGLCRDDATSELVVVLPIRANAGGNQDNRSPPPSITFE